MAGISLLQKIDQTDAYYAANLLQFCRVKGLNLILDCQADTLTEEVAAQLKPMGSQNLILSCNQSSDTRHPSGEYRALAEAAKSFAPDAPILIRNGSANTLASKDYFSDRLLESSIFSGALLCDGIGNAITIETEPLLSRRRQPSPTTSYKAPELAFQRPSSWPVQAADEPSSIYKRLHSAFAHGPITSKG